ncbi:hypothetical protein PR048_014417 [Dryococelus australis]|uniref:Uncharacterized protein n=1 Tax=Dryococelus australis TaxID=614101 RepID=A0ABQ9HEK0_9NEOP|nr:hypothetical protein PR048_014417 [Dryococelus australis]
MVQRQTYCKGQVALRGAHPSVSRANHGAPDKGGGGDDAARYGSRTLVPRSAAPAAARCGRRQPPQLTRQAVAKTASRIRTRANPITAVPPDPTRGEPRRITAQQIRPCSCLTPSSRESTYLAAAPLPRHTVSIQAPIEASTRPATRACMPEGMEVAVELPVSRSHSPLAATKELLEYAAAVWDPYVEVEVRELEKGAEKGSKMGEGLYRVVNEEGGWGGLHCKLSKGVFRGRGNNSEKFQRVWRRTNWGRQSMLMRSVREWNVLREELVSVRGVGKFRKGMEKELVG